MDAWIRFWKHTTGWALVVAVLCTIAALVDVFSNGPFDAWFAIWATLRALPTAFGLALPLTALAGAIAVVDHEREVLPRTRVIALCAVAGVIALFWTGFVGPWLVKATLTMALEGEHPANMAPETMLVVRQLYHQFLATGQNELAAGNPDARNTLRVAYGNGLQYYLPMVAGAVAVILTALGLSIGRRTRSLAPIVARIHRWGAAAIAVGAVAVACRAARVLSLQYDVPPEISAPMMALGPLLLLIPLLWTDLVATDDR